MGVFKMSIGTGGQAGAAIAAGNPNPCRFIIVQSELVPAGLAVMVRYPGVFNYEGRKILLFDRGVTLAALHDQGWIDPHFSDKNDGIYPIARFEPTERGWRMAQEVMP